MIFCLVDAFAIAIDEPFGATRCTLSILISRVNFTYFALVDAIISFKVIRFFAIIITATSSATMRPAHLWVNTVAITFHIILWALTLICCRIANATTFCAIHEFTTKLRISTTHIRPCAYALSIAFEVSCFTATFTIFTDFIIAALHPCIIVGRHRRTIAKTSCPTIISINLWVNTTHCTLFTT